MKINPAGIPQELKDSASWVLWKIKSRGGKETKVPFQMTGAEAKSNDPETWDTFDVAMQRYSMGMWDGIGFVFSADDPYCGIDLDGCRNPETGVVAPWAREIILELNSYAEVSPSQTGVKIWVRGGWPYEGHKIAIEGVERIVSKTPAIEIYDRVRYFAVTGQRLQGMVNIAERQEQLDAIRNRFWKTTAPAGQDFRSTGAVFDRARKYLAKVPAAVSGQNGHGATFHAACVLVLGFELSTDDAFALLAEWNAACQPPWSERELRHKIDDAARQSGQRGYLRNIAPQNYDRVIQPQHKMPPPPTKALPEIQVTTMDDAARKYLAAVTSGGMRLMDLGLPDLDYAIGGGVEAGEMIIFAARPGHGKSSAAQQVAHNATANGIPVAFVSEEMSSLALGKRVIQFASEVPAEHWSTRGEIVTHDIDKHFAERKPCYILEGCRSADRVAHEIAKFVKEKQVGLAIVDYAQMLTGRGHGRYEEITNVSITLKQVAAECKIPVLVLCQMSRSIEGRHKFMPVMSDLKESGQLEQDADVIVFQVWPHRIDSKEDPHEYIFYIGKNRSRPINEPSVKCRFLPSRQMLVYEKTQAPESNFEGSEKWFNGNGFGSF